MDVHSAEGQRHAIFTLWSLGQSCSEIHANLTRIHGSDSVSKMTVYRWVEKFNEGQTDVADLPRSGRPCFSASKTLPDRILDLLEENPRLAIREIADRLDTPRSTVHHCMADSMGLVKLSARWVPRLLTPDLKEQRQNICRSNLGLADEHGGWDVFRTAIVSGDETWIPHFAPLSKSESMTWAPKGSNPPVKAKQQPNCKKIMLLLFFDYRGPLTIDFLEPNATVNANRYVETLTKLKADIHNKRRVGGKPTFLHHDNARPHTATRTMETIERLHFNLLPHPPYSPDLAPADFAVFPRLKQLLRGRVYESRDCLTNEVRRILQREIPVEFYADAVNGMRTRWEKCLHVKGDYVEKISQPADEEDAD